MRFSLALLAVFLSLPAARAFPPLPDTIIYGMAKDQFGNPLQNTANQVVLVTAGGATVSTHIQPDLAVGVNYMLKVPMDAGSTPVPYVPNALTVGTRFRLYVVANGTTNLPVEMAVATVALGDAAQMMLQNLTVGGDANGDQIPDAWETAFLQSLGLNISLANINPNGIYSSDGRTLKQEYLLGNYPYNPNAIKVTIVSLKAGSAVLGFATTANRTYTVAGSADLQNWTPLPFTIPADSASTNTSFRASAAQPLQIQTLQPANAPQMQFFRVQTQ